MEASLIATSTTLWILFSLVIDASAAPRRRLDAVTTSPPSEQNCEQMLSTNIERCLREFTSMYAEFSQRLRSGDRVTDGELDVVCT